MIGHGNIGFAFPYREVRPGVWKPAGIEEKPYTWDCDRIAINDSRANRINTDMTLNSTISIVANHYINENIAYLAYVEIMGVKWKVTSVDPSNPPRLLLTLGGIYNENNGREE